VCISVQRVLVHRARFAEVRDRLALAVRRLRLGDPLAEDTDLSAMIDEAAAERVEQWIEEAVEKGAVAVVRGERHGNRPEPSLVAEPPAGVRLSNEEAFGPVATLHAYDTFEEALEGVNRSRYGLQAG